MIELWRHGGNRNHDWQRRGEYPDTAEGRAQADKDFAKIKLDLRQGAVTIGYTCVDNGHIVGFASLRYYCAPRIRTRW